MGPSEAIYLPWVIWAVSWIAASVWTNRTVRRRGFAGEWQYRVLTLAGFILLFMFAYRLRPGHIDILPWTGLLGRRLWPTPVYVGWAMVGLVTASFVFTWWARLYLGRLWSANITRKEGHQIVDTGPYAFVRHPIYTGILAAAIATAMATGTLHAVLGVVLLIAGYWLKARMEERFLRAELGAEAYDSYRRRVPMLVPFAPA